ncbi:MAG: OmpA family protein [Halomonadaceae bacterium]|nr:MAG: OmpA family protein [Halomonadaceae bacterium]
MYRHDSGKAEGITRLSAMLAASLLLAAPLSADDNGMGWNQWSASALGKYVVTDDDRNDISYGAGFRFGLLHPLDHHWELELAGFGNILGRDERDGRDWQYGLGADFLYNLRPEGITPYGIAGAGGVFNDFSSGNEFGPYANIGVGLRLPVAWNRISVRAEARYYIDYADDAASNSRHDDARFFLGIQFPLFDPPVAPEPLVRTEVVERERVVERIPSLQRLDGVKFEFDSTRLDPNARIVLRRVAEDLAVHDHVTVNIEGHTDNQGGVDYNYVLSEGRANAVRDFLVEQGVEGDRITTEGFGLDKPIADNETVEGREINRRIEMRRTDQAQE